MVSTYRKLPDGNLIVHIPMQLVRSANGLRLVALEPGANLDRNKEMANIQMVATGVKYRGVAVTDAYRSRSKMATSYGFDSSYLTRVIRLGYLSPVIVDKITRGELSHISVERLMKVRSPLWAEQHKELGIEDDD